MGPFVFLAVGKNRGILPVKAFDRAMVGICVLNR